MRSGSWRVVSSGCLVFFFFNDTATTEIYTLSLHDALPIFRGAAPASRADALDSSKRRIHEQPGSGVPRSEEHTSELQSRLHLVCRLLLEKKNNREALRPDSDSLAHRPRIQPAPEPSLAGAR